MRDHIQDLKDKGVEVNNFDEMIKEIKNHIQDLKDEGVRAKIDDEQIENLVNKILGDKSVENISVENKSVEDKSVEDENVKEFLKYCKVENLNTYYTIKSDRYFIKENDIHDAFKDYISERITRDKFFEKYNIFKNEFSKFIKVQSKKKIGAIFKRN